jgi:Xaa-Pro aminopeptidase
MKIKHLLIGLFATLSIQPAMAQDYPTDYLSPEFHAGRRAAFKEKMSDKGVGIFFASQTRQRSNDTEFQYAQNKNFYYLTGLEEPNAVLLLHYLGRLVRNLSLFKTGIHLKNYGQVKFLE